MTRRVQLHIDILHHINDLIFRVYRSTEPEVSKEDTHLMDVDQNLAIKDRYQAVREQLGRDSETPYLFHVSRHYETDTVQPAVFLNADPVDDDDLYYLSDQKEIEIHSGEIGVFDGRPVFMDYEYLAMPLWDDYDVESGKTYYGPPATGLRVPMNFEIEQDLVLKKFRIKYDYNRDPIAYYYKIFAEDTSGSVSPWSDTRVEMLTPSDVFFRVERSADEETWEPVVLSNMYEWLDDYHVTDSPLNVMNAEVTPIDSKESRITFENPWKHFVSYNRASYTYRVRAEDGAGESTEWLYVGPVIVYMEPKEIVIRRKLDNGTSASKDGIDAFTVFTIQKTDVDVHADVITLIDDQLNEALIYSYTFFYEDELSRHGEPFFLVSDHTPWLNIILFASSQKETSVPHDFFTSFELADRVIEIGIEEGS